MIQENIYLTRSPSELVEDNLAGYGWPQVDFSQAETTEELLGFFAEKKIDLGRQRNQIIRFFSISKGDIIVVPIHRAIAIGYATGTKSYAKGIGYGENRVGVEFLRNPDGSLLRIPRSKLIEALSTRLRIRMTVVSLNEFRDEIISTIDRVKNDGSTSFDSRIDALEAEAHIILQQKLLANIQDGKTFLKSGGEGLEKLVQELFNTEGYSTKIFAKNAHKGLADADIEAIRADHFSSNRLLIQVKHHTGTTGTHAFRQLLELEADDDTKCWLITTAHVSPDVAEKAASDGIGIMDGEGLSDWIIKQAHLLSAATCRYHLSQLSSSV